MELSKSDSARSQRGSRTGKPDYRPGIRKLHGAPETLRPRLDRIIRGHILRSKSHTQAPGAPLSPTVEIRCHKALRRSQATTTIFRFGWRAIAAAPDSFTASFGSDEVLDLVNPGVLGYTLEDFTVTATGTSTTIEFDGASTGGGWAVDDVSVTDQGPAAPEPASLVLLASGLLAIAWRRRQHNETRIPHMRQNGFWILASAILLAASAVPARANLITNPGFESCTFPINTYPTGWTETGSVSCSPGTVHTGNYTAVLPTDSTLSQTITTVAGENYDFSFWLLTEISSPSSITGSFGGDEVLDLVNPASFGYTLEDFSVTATGTSTTIAFSTTGSGGGSAIDDVSVTDLGPATPEPASLLLLASGLLAIAWRFRHRIHSDSRVLECPLISASIISLRRLTVRYHTKLRGRLGNRAAFFRSFP